MTWQAIGLILFIAMSIIVNAALAWDLSLWINGQQLITTYCRQHPWAAWLILMGCMVGVMGLAVHLMADVKIKDAPPC